MAGAARCLDARDLGGALTPLAVRELQRELDDRLRKVPTRLNEYGFDPYGLSPDVGAQRRAAGGAALPLLLPRRDATTSSGSRRAACS